MEGSNLGNRLEKTVELKKEIIAGTCHVPDTTYLGASDMFVILPISLQDSYYPSFTNGESER